MKSAFFGLIYFPFCFAPLQHYHHHNMFVIDADQPCGLAAFFRPTIHPLSPPGVSAPRASGGWHEPLLVLAAGCAHPLLSGISGDDGDDGDERNCGRTHV